MKKGQIFGIITYDALFKWVLSSDSIRPSFFHAFIPGIVVQSSERLDDHMNPLQELQLLRNIINNAETTNLVVSLKENQSDVKVHVDDSYHEKATRLLGDLLHHFDDIQYSFPKLRFDGTMDFVCRLDTGEYALIEMQVIPERHWDQRELAYVAAFYGNQLRRKTPWKEIRKVIGLNILGGGKNNEKHWQDAPDQYVRHYRFQEQLHKENPPRFLEGIDIIQYSLANAPKNVDTQEQKDWLRFLKDAHNMTEEDVKREIKTPAVLEAFERAKLVSLPESVKKNYDDEDVMYENFSDYIAGSVAEGKAEGKAEGMAEGEAKGRAEGRAEGIAEGEAKGEAKKAKVIALALLEQGVAISVIQAATGLSKEELLMLGESHPEKLNR